MTDWGDLDARARGLAGHLLDRRTLERLAAAPEPAALGRALEGAGAGREGGAEAARDPERAARRSLAGRLALLARWAGPRRRSLRVLFEDEDRRSVRVLLRGAVQGATAGERLRGLVPTPTLDEDALAAAAAERTVEGVVGSLAESGHPWAADLLARIEAAPFDLFQLETEVNRIFARRAADAVRRGEARLAFHVGRTIDLENAWTTLLADALAGEVDPAAAWLDGGAALDRKALDEIAALEGVGPRRDRIAAAFGATPVGRAFSDSSVELPRLEVAALRARIAEERAAFRHDPLSTAPLIEFALRLRAEAIDLGRVVWGVALGAPERVVAGDLATT